VPSKALKKPPFDPAPLLDQLKRIVGNTKKSTKSGGKAWVGILVSIVVALVGVAVSAWFAWRRNKELAKLRHEGNKRKILLAQEIAANLVAKNDAEIAKAQARVEAAKEKLKANMADIRAEEARHEADLRAIDSIRSWRDAGIS
jgi:uncharacterized protein HemX